MSPATEPTLAEAQARDDGSGTARQEQGERQNRRNTPTLTQPHDAPTRAPRGRGGTFVAAVD